MNNLQQIQGVTFENTNEYDRGQVVGYHSKPSPIFRNKALPVDVQGLKSEDRRVIKMEGEEAVSKYTIGFEIEKTVLFRSAVKEYPLFCGFERDGSCGYEAVTHVLPLLPKSLWRTKVFNMFKQAEKIIDDRYSPSDHKCGGHITIAVDGMSGYELQQAIRKNAGIIYALFRMRLSNNYCRFDIFMDADEPRGLSVHNSSKYRVSKVMTDCLEFRIPSRVQSVKQMMRRYELMYEIVDFSINNPNGSFSTLLKKVTPIIKSMYEGDMEKVNEILSISKSFRKMILTKKVNKEVIRYVDKFRQLDARVYYDRNVYTNNNNEIF